MLLNHSAVARRILLIDDDVELAQMLREYLEPNQCQLTLAHTRSQGQTLLAQDDFDLVLLDLMLPDGNGLDLRSHQGICRDQWRLSELRPTGRTGCT